MIKDIFNKIFTFKNIMFTLCIGIAVISTFFSCEVRAYTNEDLTNFINQLLLNDNVNSTTKDRLGTLKNNLNSLFTYMSNNNIDLSDYKGFAFNLQNRQGAFNMNLIQNDSVPSHQNQSYFIKPYTQIHRDNYGYFSLSINVNSVISIASSDSASYFNYFGLTDGLYDNIYPFGNLNYFDNYYTPTILFDYSPVYSVASGDFTYIKINYVSNFVPLGVLGSNEYYQLDAKFRDDLSMNNLFNWSDVPGTRINFIRSSWIQS